MRRSICKWVLTHCFHLEDCTRNPWPTKCIIALAPHTSNWDFIIGMLFLWSHRQQANFLMKSEWFFWPMGILMRYLGGIPVRRSKNTSMTDQLAARAAEMPVFHLCITPEGTRRPTTEWKHGFFYIAQKAQIPVVVYALDFKTRRILEGDTFVPSADMKAEDAIARMKEFYRGMEGKKPGKFIV
ncbi:MAG: 1-acyl-sn-glycerol-3-phosphate acyltransferase [Bacteroidaceae bacterium]|nr:1-acyl-sn-glycerol-3-phosphate acyltransferase [Bacteroidaceae bacterium]